MAGETWLITPVGCQETRMHAGAPLAPAVWTQGPGTVPALSALFLLLTFRGASSETRPEVDFHGDSKSSPADREDSVQKARVQSRLSQMPLCSSTEAAEHLYLTLG